MYVWCASTQQATYKDSSIYFISSGYAFENRTRAPGDFNASMPADTIFILSNSLRISMNISDWINLNITKRELAKDCTYRLPYWYMISVPISQILMDLNSSVNFSIYCAFNNSFRSVINDHVGKIFEWCLPRNYCNQRSRHQDGDAEIILMRNKKHSIRLLSTNQIH